MHRQVIVLGALCCVAACATPAAIPAETIPAISPRDSLLAALPAGPAVIASLQIDRIRENPQLSEVWKKIENDESLMRADRIVIAAYDVGSAQAEMLTLYEGVLEADEARVLGAKSIGENRWAVGPKVLVEKSGVGQTLGSEWSPIWDAAKPQGIRTAIFRLAARFSFEERIRLSNLSGIDKIPARLSLWVDARDDFAAILAMECDSIEEAVVFKKSLLQWQKKLAGGPRIRALLIHRAVLSMKISQRGKRVNVVFLLGPRYFRMVIHRLNSQFPNFSHL